MTRLTGVLGMAVVVAAGAWSLGACTEEISRTEKTGRTWDGKTQHEETTVYKNPDGSLSTEHQKQVVR